MSDTQVWDRRITVRARRERHGLFGLGAGDFYPTNQGNFEVYIESAITGIVAHRIGVDRPGMSPESDNRVYQPAGWWTVPFYAGEDALIKLWQDVTVPDCVKNAVERLHSQHRRLCIPRPRQVYKLPSLLSHSQ